MTILAHVLAQSQSDETVVEVLGSVQTVLQYAGTVAFAISGALVAGKKRMDLAGVAVLGAIVAVGGGTIRDLLLDQNPVSWIADPIFVVVAVVCALATIPLFKSGALDVIQRFDLVRITDAAGMAVFVITGTNVAVSAGADSLSAAIIGVIAGVGGGVIRDIMANEIPDVLKSGQFYATAALAGALIYVGLLDTSLSPLITLWFPMIAIFAIRMASIRYGWGIPKFDTKSTEGTDST